MIRRIIHRVGLFLAAAIGVVAAGVCILVGLYAKEVYTPPSGEVHGRIISGGEERSYVLHIPGSYDPTSTPYPLVISMHGFAEWPGHQMEISRWNEAADRHDFFVVYPAGTGFPLHWRISGEDGRTDVPMTDVEFISDLIDVLLDRYPIDPARIYANGLSNGGGMADMLACTLSDRIAAVGGVAGAYLFPPKLCRPTRPVPVIAFHGTADPIVPYAGGGSFSPHSDFLPVREWAAGWAARNGCWEESMVQSTVGEINTTSYGGCRENAGVVLFTIFGGGHTWPGGEPLPELLTGRTTREIDATAEMWRFFYRNPMPIQ